MLQPKRTKFRKVQKGRVRGKAYRGSELAFGEYGLQSLDHGLVTARQIEAARPPAPPARLLLRPLRPRPLKPPLC